jgi:hypothetical protein
MNGWMLLHLTLSFFQPFNGLWFLSCELNYENIYHENVINERTFEVVTQGLILLLWFFIWIFGKKLHLEIFGRESIHLVPNHNKSKNEVLSKKCFVKL